MEKQRRVQRALVACMGEAAARIIAALRAADVESVGIFTRENEDSPYLDDADYPVMLMAAQEGEQAFSDPLPVLSCAMDAAADAILAGTWQAPLELVQMLNNVGVGWVGPKPDHLQWVADVEAQRREARESGMEVIPSSPPLKSMEDAKIWADRIGPPLLERRDGKIARRRLTAADVAAAVRDVEVLSTIGVQCTFERAIVPARHIVVVAVGNGRGNAVYLPEMEQSLRFDGQVLLRECPAPHLSPELQARLGDGAVQVASRLGWLGPLTVEYLLSADNHAWFYRFHGALPDGYWLIESVAGVDLVAASLSLAVGDALNWTQEEIPVQGHAIQLPIYALKTGVLEVLQLPEGALALRAEGATVQPGECGRVAGLMVTAPTRQAALVRAQVLLRDVHVEGIESNLEHLLATLGKREVWDGKMNDHL